VAYFLDHSVVVYLWQVDAEVVSNGSTGVKIRKISVRALRYYHRVRRWVRWNDECTSASILSRNLWIVPLWIWVHER